MHSHIRMFGNGIYSTQVSRNSVKGKKRLGLREAKTTYNKRQLCRRLFSPFGYEEQQSEHNNGCPHRYSSSFLPLLAMQSATLKHSRDDSLPSIGHDSYLQVYTHKSLRRPGAKLAEYDDNERLSVLGAKALEMAVLDALMGERPFLSADQLEVRRVVFLSNKSPINCSNRRACRMYWLPRTLTSGSASITCAPRSDVIQTISLACRRPR